MLLLGYPHFDGMPDLGYENGMCESRFDRHRPDERIGFARTLQRITDQSADD